MGLIVALGFLTTLPVPRRAATATGLARSLAFFPIVGALLGGLLVALDLLLLPLLPAGLRAAVLLVALIALTRGLHLDGLMDTCDGVFGGFTPERRLAIMRDSRAGAFGVLAAVGCLLLRFAGWSALGWPGQIAALMLPPILGRWALVYATVAFPYGREEGLGRAFKEAAGWRELLIATPSAALLALACWWPWGVALLLFALTVAFAVAHFLLRRLPGLTGDCYGAINEVVEVTALLVIVGVHRGWAYQP